MALDTLQVAVWTPSDVSLDRAGRRLPGWRDCPVRAELHSGRDHRRFCSGLAADRGGVVCATDGVEIGCSIGFSDSWERHRIVMFQSCFLHKNMV